MHDRPIQSVSTYIRFKKNVWTNLKRCLGLGQVLPFGRRSCPPPLRFRSSSLILAAALLHCRSSTSLIYFGASYSCNSYSNIFLYLSDGTSSLLPQIVMYEKFKSFSSTTSSNLLLQILDPSSFYHLIAFNQLQPRTLISLFATQLNYNSTFNLYRRFNTNSHSIFN